MRFEKTSVVNELQKKVHDSSFVIVVDYTGMKVEQFGELRNRLEKGSSRLHVVKNTFLRRALKNESLPELEDDLTGQSAVVLGDSDMAGAAKVLKTFVSEFQKPKIKVGILDRAVLDNKSLMAIADLPPREVLLAKLLGLINAPATTLARLIKTPASQLAQVIKAHAEKGE